MHYLVYECSTSLHPSDNDLLSCLDKGHSWQKSLQATGQGFDRLLLADASECTVSTSTGTTIATPQPRGHLPRVTERSRTVTRVYTGHAHSTALSTLQNSQHLERLGAEAQAELQRQMKGIRHWNLHRRGDCWD